MYYHWAGKHNSMEGENMNCAGCKKPLSFRTKNITLTTPFGEFKTKTVVMTVADDISVQLSVTCPTCHTTHDIAYCGATLVQALDKDENQIG